MKCHGDIPAFCFTREYEEREDLLTGTSELFRKSDAIKHCETSMCYDVDPVSGEFTYLLGRGIFHPDDLKKIPADKMVQVEIKGLYAVFSTPPVPFEQHDRCAQVIQETWNEILTQWLPHSEFEYDETRRDYEYYDYRTTVGILKTSAKWTFASPSGRGRRQDRNLRRGEAPLGTGDEAPGTLKLEKEGPAIWQGPLSLCSGRV